MDTQTIINIILPIATGIAGWFTGGKKRKRDSLREQNNLLSELQSSVDMLLEKNKTLLDEIINLRGENADLKYKLELIQRDHATMKDENAHLQTALNTLIAKLEEKKEKE
jgi:chromosome segregation ATPase